MYCPCLCCHSFCDSAFILIGGQSVQAFFLLFIYICIIVGALFIRGRGLYIKNESETTRMKRSILDFNFMHVQWLSIWKGPSKDRYIYIWLTIHNSMIHQSWYTACFWTDITPIIRLSIVKTDKTFKTFF